MRFTIVASKCLPFSAHTIEERPLGGTESAVIRLAEALHKRGHEISVYTTLSAHSETSQPKYYSLEKVNAVTETDILLTVRDWFPVFLPIKAKLRLFWTGDSYDQITSVGIGDRRVAAKIDMLLAVSAWHASTLSLKSNFPLEKTWVIRNGVHLPYFEGNETRVRKRLIYSSTPYRGLELVPDLYQELKTKHPELELYVFSGYQVYKGETEYDTGARKHWDALREKLSKLPGCNVHENVTQKALAREFMKASILFYPNTFEETSCITAMEAQAAGCTIVTSDLGALKETVGPAGILVPGKPGTKEYSQVFIEETHKLLTDDALYSQLSSIGINRSKELFDWNKVAERFEAYLHTFPLQK